jgi:arylsulfatase A-like enzyme
VFIQISEDHVGRALRTARWKYEVAVPADAPWSGWTAAGSARYREAYLYDLAADPHERNNLVADSAFVDVRNALAARLRQQMVAAGEVAPVIAPAMAD